MIYEELEKLIVKTILAYVPKDKKIGVLFSGGVDSVLIAKILKDNNIEFTCYTASSKEDYKDSIAAKKAAEELGFKLKVIHSESLEEEIIKISSILQSVNFVTINIAIPLYLAMQKASEDGIEIVFSGLGTEELYAGYQRHGNAIDINEECRKGLENINERDIERDEALAKYFNLKLAVPFLDKKLIEYSLTIPGEEKIKDGYKKYILRQIAENLGVPKEYAWRKKLAVQYGSGIDKELERLAKSKGFKFKSEYVNYLLNKNIGALISTGKDSLFAMYKMIQRGYNISCLLTIKSKNEDSYMFHTPTIELAKDISELVDIPIIFGDTEGNKEQELQDLEDLIKKAIEKYKIEGIVSGAISSEYQRKRLQEICNKLNIISYTPLWGKNEEELLGDMIKKGFKIMITKTAAEGLDKEWVGKLIDNQTIEELKEISKKYNISIIGEGGEYETLVLKAPFYKDELKIR